MKAGRAYWLCQILGWGLYSALGIAGAAQAVGWRLFLFIGYGAYFLYSIALTHLYRGVIRRQKWGVAITLGNAARLLAGALVVGAIQSFLVIWIDFLLEGNRSGFRQPVALVGLTMGVTGVTVVWTILYLTLTYNRRAHEKDVTLELLRREAELRDLESKVNPHFLFNCLNSIRALVAEDPAKAQEMITRFAAILRYNLNRDMSRLVSLAEEVEVAGDYLALESVRFEERLDVHFEIEPEAAKTPVPPMLLQTLVENALKHGVAKLPAGGAVTMRAAVEDGNLVIVVENTGRLEPADSRNGGGHGLKIARERLRLLYADRAKLEVTEQAGGTVAATVLLPGAQ
jgi:two-component system, LytTR family, sensor kinase